MLLAQCLALAWLLLCNCLWLLSSWSPWSRGSQILFQQLILTLSPAPLLPPGIKNSFQTLHIVGENITNSKDLSHHVLGNTLKQTNYTQEHQAAFHFGKPLPNYLIFSNLHMTHLGHRSRYRLQIYSKIHQVRLPDWEKKRGVSWTR